MKLSFKNGLVLVKPQHSKDANFLDKFPGLLKTGEDAFTRYCVATSPVVKTLVDRMKRAKIAVTADEAVFALYKAEWKLKALPASFSYHTQPLPFQDIALRFCHTYDGGGVLLEPGLGKTKVILDFIRLTGEKPHLVICPNALRFVWQDETATHRPDLRCFVASTTNFDDIDWTADLVVLNYEKAVEMSDRLIKYSKNIAGVHIDEGLIKNPYSKRSELAHAMAHNVRYRTVMSGTLVNNSPLDVFSVIKFLQPCLVGSSFSKFRDRYAIMKKVERANQGGANFKMLLGYKDVDEVKATLDACSIVMTKAEWLRHLPKKVFEDIKVKISDEQRTAFNDLLTNKFLRIGPGEVAAELPITMAAKLYQISNGFLYMGDEFDENAFLNDLFSDDTVKVKKKTRKATTRQTYFFTEQPKIIALIQYLAANPKEKCIVWFNSIAEAELIEKALREWNIPYIDVKGGAKDIGEKVHAFNTDESRVLLAQARVINYGVTVMGSNKGKLSEDEIETSFPTLNPVVATEIFYSLSFSLEIYLQQQDRIHRIGQVRTCKYVRLIADTEIEKKVIEALDNKMNVREEMLEDVIASLKGETITRKELEKKPVRRKRKSDAPTTSSEPLPDLEGID